MKALINLRIWSDFVDLNTLSSEIGMSMKVSKKKGDEVDLKKSRHFIFKINYCSSSDEHADNAKEIYDIVSKNVKIIINKRNMFIRDGNILAEATIWVMINRIKEYTNIDFLRPLAPSSSNEFYKIYVEQYFDINCDASWPVREWVFESQIKAMT